MMIISSEGAESFMSLVRSLLCPEVAVSYKQRAPNGASLVGDAIRKRNMIRVPTKRPPTHPGEMLHEEFLVPMEIDARQLAESIRVSPRSIEEIISDQKSITPSIALRLAKYFGMSADFWMNLQLRWDLYQTQKAESKDLEAIRPHVAA